MVCVRDFSRGKASAIVGVVEIELKRRAVGG